MMISKVLGLKMVFSDHKMARQPQKWSKMSKQVQNSPNILLSALMGKPTAVTLVINNYIFRKWS